MPPRPACARCHEKKIKCNGLPNCRNCVNARARCEPHARARRALAYHELRERMSWLESEVSTLFGLDCPSIATHTPLASLMRRSSHWTTENDTTTPQSRGGYVDDEQSDRSASSGRGEALSTHPDASDVGLLALNATGELRYLGPSSGSFFFNATSSLLRASKVNRSAGPPRHPLGCSSAVASTPQKIIQSSETITALSAEAVEVLLLSFKMWIQPLHPLLSDEELSQVQERALSQPAGNQDGEAVPISLILALGAVNLSHTVKERQIVGLDHSRLPSANALYEEAVGQFETCSRHFRPSLSLITTLLLFCIYSSYGATKDTQWQLAGISMRMAVEMGLHSSNRNRRVPPTEKDRRTRVFWTAYMIEMSLCWNLGRPPSLVDEHISVESLPAATGSLGFATQQLYHRQIQGRIINTVYATNVADASRLDHSHYLVETLQRQLDEWRDQLRQLFSNDVESAYPLSYWERLHGGTSSVLHRPNPLLPHPPASSLVKCIRSSGAYIDHLLSTVRTSNVPLTWMLVQGLLFAGLTLLVVARAHIPTILEEAGPSFLLVEVPNWTRRCSTCLAIMRERWDDALLKKLDSQFETLAEITLQRVATAVVTPRERTSTMRNDAAISEPLLAPAPSLESSKETQGASTVSRSAADGVRDAVTVDGGPALVPSDLSGWETPTFFDDMMGFDNDQDLWSDFMGQSGFDILGALGDDNANFPSM